jgi:hypothetical protein
MIVKRDNKFVVMDSEGKKSLAHIPQSNKRKSN